MASRDLHPACRGMGSSDSSLLAVFPGWCTSSRALVQSIFILFNCEFFLMSPSFMSLGRAVVFHHLSSAARFQHLHVLTILCLPKQPNISLSMKAARIPPSPSTADLSALLLPRIALGLFQNPPRFPFLRSSLLLSCQCLVPLTQPRLLC